MTCFFLRQATRLSCEVSVLYGCVICLGFYWHFNWLQFTTGFKHFVGKIRSFFSVGRGWRSLSTLQPSCQHYILLRSLLSNFLPFLPGPSFPLELYMVMLSLTAGSSLWALLLWPQPPVACFLALDHSSMHLRDTHLIFLSRHLTIIHSSWASWKVPWERMYQLALWLGFLEL